MPATDFFPGLPEILFAVKDAKEVEREVVRAYEDAAGRSLAPGDPVRLFLLTIASVIVQQRTLIDYTGKQNLLAYSSSGYLDHLGALLGVCRLAAAPALTTLRFTLSSPQPGAVTIPVGTRATPGGGSFFFATARSATIPPGEISVDVDAACTAPGIGGNGFFPGQIRKLVDLLPWVSSVENITETTGGTDVEEDENLRERIHVAPEKFSVAGPFGAYEYWALTAHQGIIDVSVVGPPTIDPGEVAIFPLMTGGAIPSQEVLDLVYSRCNAEDIRPLTDHVTVAPPEIVSYTVSLQYWILRRNATRALAIRSAVEKTVEEWVDWQRSKIGRDILPSELVRRVQSAGAKRVEVTSPKYTALNYKQLGVASSVNVVYGGLEDE